MNVVVQLRWSTVSPTVRSIQNRIMLTDDPLLIISRMMAYPKNHRDVDKPIVSFAISILLLICEGNGC